MTSDEAVRRRRIIEIALEASPWKEGHFRWSTAFEALIATILSQNTNDRNSRLAWNRLKSRIGLNLKALSEADLQTIRECIRPAGLHSVKANRIMNIARMVSERFPEGLEKLLNEPDDKVRRELMKMKGVGPKTVDVVLAFYGKRDILPVDTHVKRLAERLGFTGIDAGYGEVKSSLEEATPRGLRRQAHLSLIWMGRNICFARRPACRLCSLSELCPSSLVKKGLHEASRKG